MAYQRHDATKAPSFVDQCVGVAETAALSPMARSIDHVEGHITMLLSEIDTLERKLDGVLIASPNQALAGDSKTAAAPQPINSPIGYHIEAQADRLQMAMRRVRDLVERLAV